MGGASRWGPQQHVWAERVGLLVDKHPGADAAVLRAALGEAGLLCPDVAVAEGPAPATLLDAMAVAEVLGERLPREVTAALLDGCPARVLGVLEKGRTQREAVVRGATPLALVDVTGSEVKVERRPGGNSRLAGDVPARAVAEGARWVLFVFEERRDFLGVALVAAHHAALRTVAVEGLPLVWMGGVLDVEMAEGDVDLDASLEVARALASEELVRAARAVGEAWGSLGRDAARVLFLPRTALYAAAERLVDGGPYTLLGEETRLGSMAAALEARAAVRAALEAVRGALWSAALPSEAWVRLDLGGSVPHDVTRGPRFRLGDARQGGVASARARTTTQRPEARTPLPEGEPRATGRVPTGRMAAAAAEWGSLGFVPAPLRRLQLDARQFVVEHFEPGAAALVRDGRVPAAAWDTAAGRGLLGAGAPTTVGGLDLGLAGILVVLEEAGRTHPALGISVLGSALGAWWAGADPAAAPLAQGKAWGALSTEGELRVADGRVTGSLTVCGRPDASRVLCRVGGGVGLVAAVPAADVRERDLPVCWRVELVRAELVAHGVGGAAEERLGTALALCSVARQAGWCAAVLEGWRASLNGRPEGTRLTQAHRLGAAWAALLQVRAGLWSLAGAADGGGVLEHATGLARAARALADRVGGDALEGAGAEAVRPGVRVAELLRHAAAWRRLEG